MAQRYGKKEKKTNSGGDYYGYMSFSVVTELLHHTGRSVLTFSQIHNHPNSQTSKDRPLSECDT
jgi:hypothetical protein